MTALPAALCRALAYCCLTLRYGSRADALTKVFSEDIGQMYARGVQPRFPEAGEPTDNQMSVVITRLGWFVRNTAESEGLAQAGAYGAYLSHDDCGRYMVRVVESPTPGKSAPTSAVLIWS